MPVLVEWLSFCPDNPAAPNVRWDSRFLERILAGTEWRVPNGFTYQPFGAERSNEGRVIVFPCGHYKEHCGTDRALQRLERHVRAAQWSLVIATSDEGSTFPWHLFSMPPNCLLWVQTPRPDHRYPRRTRFFGFGSPASAREIASYAKPDWEKDIEIFFSGQITHSKRSEMWAALEEVLVTNEHPTSVVRGTDGFATGMPFDEYYEHMVRADVVPCPSGPLTQDTFRYYEALEAQAVPLVDEMRPDGRGGNYWDMVGRVGMVVGRWSKRSVETALALHSRPWDTPLCSSRWQQEKRRLAHHLHEDVTSLSGRIELSHAPDDEITVIMVTSPSPLHPDSSIIETTLESVVERLPAAEILLGFDGVREEQDHRANDYWEFARRMCAMTNESNTICPFVFTEHHHQSGMVLKLLDEVTTPYIMFIEGDCPLVAHIDFDAVLAEMQRHDLNHMRFLHEAQVLEEHEHLFLETRPRFGTRHLRTVQYSTRPSVIRTDWMRRMMTTYFTPRSRTMIEDVLYGPLQHGWTRPYTNRKRLLDVWSKHRAAIWAPYANIKHSTHLDGRGSDPKYPMFMSYPEGEPPEGAPVAGWHNG